MTPIERVSIVDQLIIKLTDIIKENNLNPGDKMPTEKEVCEMFHVGRSTVREAYRMMQVMGIIESRQGSGSVIAQKHEIPTQDEVRCWFKNNGTKISDYMEARMAVEPISTALAVQRANNDEINHIKEIHNLFQHAAIKTDVLKLAKLDEAFHIAITKSSHNKLLAEMEKMISSCIFDYRIRAFSISGNIEHALIPHGEILQSFYSHDFKAAEKAMQYHLRISLYDMEKIISK